MAIAIGQFTIYDMNDIIAQPTAPLEPQLNQVWLDTSVEPPLIKTWNGSSWVVANDIIVGGRNILRNTALVNGDYFTFDKGTSLDTIFKFENNNTIKFDVSNSSFDNIVGATPDSQSVTINEYYSASASVFIPTSNGMNEDTYIALEIQCFNALGDCISTFTRYVDKTITNSWQRVKLENKLIPVSTATATAKMYVRGNGSFWIANIQLERGSKATDWTPATEDVDESIDNVKKLAEEAEKHAQQGILDAELANQKLTEIASDKTLTPSEKQQVSRMWEEIKLQKPSIIAQANVYQVSVTEFNNAYNSLSTYVTSLDLDSQSVTEIIPSVFNTNFNTYYEKRQWILDEIAKKTKEYADSVGESIVIGGRNILRNTSFTLGTNGKENWINWDGSWLITSAESDSPKSKIIKNTQSGIATNQIKSVYSARYKCQNGESYVYSMDIKVDDFNAWDVKAPFIAEVYDNTGTRIQFKDVYISDMKLTTMDNGRWYRVSYVLKVNNVNADTIGMRIALFRNGTLYVREPQLELGTKATNWSPAPEDLENGIVVVLSNEAQVIPTDKDRKPFADKTYSTGITVFQGGSQRTDFTIGTISSANGITVTKSSSQVDFKVSSSTVLTQDDGAFTIPITIDNKTFNKVFSWACSKQGNTGETGANGEDAKVVSIIPSGLIFKSTDGSVYTPSTISLTPSLQNVTYSKWQYSTNGSTWSDVINGQNGLTISNSVLTVSSSSPLFTGSVTSIGFKIITNVSNVTDTVTIARVSDGKDGANGVNGADAQYVTVSGEQVFRYTNNFNGSPTPTIIKLTAVTTGMSSPTYAWSYRVPSSTTLTTISGATSSTYDIAHDNAIWGTHKQLTFRCTSNGKFDEITVIKVSDGATGDTGNGVKTTTITYQASSSGTTVPTGTWSSTIPSVSAGQYLWTRTVTAYTDNTSTTAYSVGRMGTNGTNGANGADGANGTDGKGVKSTVVDYQANTSGTTPPNGSWSTSVPTVSQGQYLWTRTTITYTDNATTVSYSVGRMGQNGVDGANGADAYTVVLTNESHAFPTENNGNIGTAISTTSDVIAYKGGATITPTIGTLPSVTGLTLSKSGNTITIQANTGTSLADTGSFIIPITVDGKAFSKTFSWSKAKKGDTGANGSNGTNGTNGTDGYTILLTNEAQVIPTDKDRKPTDNFTFYTDVLVYKGATSTSFTIGTVNSANNITVSKPNTTRVQFAVSTSTAILMDTGTFTIPIIIDGVTYNKTFSWSVSKQGLTGANGSNGTNGTNGVNAKSADIIASTQVFKSNDGGDTFTPNTITLTPNLQYVTYSNWQYSTNGGSTWSTVVSGQDGLTISGNALLISKSSTLYTDTITSVAFRLNTSDSSVYDTATIFKVYDVNDLEVGGVNLLPNTDFSRLLTSGKFKWTLSGSSYLSIVDIDDPKVPFKNSLYAKTTTNTSAGVNFAFIPTDTSDLIGAKYTLTFYVKYAGVTKGTNDWNKLNLGKMSLVYTDVLGATSNDYPTLFSEVGDSDWIKVERKVTLKSDKKFVRGSINFYLEGCVGEFWITGIQLERGNKATDWKPAPQDLTDISAQYIDTQISDVIKENQSIMDMVNKIASDGFVTDVELSDLKLIMGQVDSQYRTMASTIDKFNNEYLNGYKTSLKTAYDMAKALADPILSGTVSEGAVELKNAVNEFYDKYHDCLFAISSLTKDNLDETKATLKIHEGRIDMAIMQSGTAHDTTVEIGKHMSFTDNWLELYGTINGAQSQFKARLSDTRLSFFDGGNEVAYVGNKKLNIETAEIKNQLQVGDYAMTKSSKGGIVFKKI